MDGLQSQWDLILIAAVLYKVVPNRWLLIARPLCLWLEEVLLLLWWWWWWQVQCTVARGACRMWARAGVVRMCMLVGWH